MRSHDAYYLFYAAAAAKSLQLCPTLCDPIDGSPPGSPVPGILQARTLEWVVIFFSNHESEKWKWSRSVVSDSSWPHGPKPTRLLRPWDLPGKSTGVGCLCLLHLFYVTCFFFPSWTMSIFPFQHVSSHLITNHIYITQSSPKCALLLFIQIWIPSKTMFASACHIP